MTENRTELVTAIVVTYNSADDIEDCLGALGPIPAWLRVIVIDNNSGDDSLSRAKAALPAAVCIQNYANVGFAIAVNQGAAMAAETNVLLLNPDCRISAREIGRLVARLREDPLLGVVAPAIAHPQGRLVVRSAGFEPTLRHMLAQAVGVAGLPATARFFRGFNLYAAREAGPMTEVDWVSGACLLVRQGVWQEIGGMSERWFMYAEDIEFCRRIRARGLRVVHDSSSTALHAVGASSESLGGPVWTMWIDNLVDYYRVVHRPSSGKFLIWRWTVAGGQLLRSGGYRLRSLIRPRERRLWRRESTKFYAYSMAALGRSSSRGSAE